MRKDKRKDGLLDVRVSEGSIKPLLDQEGEVVATRRVVISLPMGATYSDLSLILRMDEPHFTVTKGCTTYCGVNDGKAIIRDGLILSSFNVPYENIENFLKQTGSISSTAKHEFQGVVKSARFKEDRTLGLSFGRGEAYYIENALCRIDAGEGVKLYSIEGFSTHSYKVDLARIVNEEGQVKCDIVLSPNITIR